ncbi:MAG: DJ-1/PfpI family protein [Fluviicola sp.]|nr:DJ-1/PfpI family protein [Fluviicola sp.]
MELTTFSFLVLPHIHLMDMAGPDQTILEAIEYGAPFEITYCGLGDSPITSSGFTLGKTELFSSIELKKGDYLIIPGASVDYLLTDEFRKNTELFDWINKQYQKGVNLVTICAGAFVLGLCGLLDDIRCTTHFKRTTQLAQLFPKAKVLENILYTEENNIYTSAGIASGIDLTLHIIEQNQGSYFTHKVARELVVYNRRDGNQQQQSALMQFRNHIHNGIHKAQDHIIEHIHIKHHLYDLAELANMSERNFTRIFKAETGITVNEFINSIRRETVEQLAKNPDLSKLQIANKVGLQSEKQLGRLLALS